MRKVLANDPEHPRVFAHILDDGTIDIRRQDQQFTIIGENFTLIGTNPQGTGKTVLMVKDKKLVEDDLQFKNEETKDGEEEPNGEAEEPVQED